MSRVYPTSPLPLLLRIATEGFFAFFAVVGAIGGDWLPALAFAAVGLLLHRVGLRGYYATPDAFVIRGAFTDRRYRWPDIAGFPIVTPAVDHYARLDRVGVDPVPLTTRRHYRVLVLRPVDGPDVVLMGAGRVRRRIQERLAVRLEALWVARA